MNKHYTNRNEWLDKLNAKWPKPSPCQGCSLLHSGAGFARSSGSGRNGIALLGSQLDETGAEKGLPFQGEAGTMLTRVLHRMGLKKDDFLLLNLVSCNTPFNRAPTVQEIDKCSHYLNETLAQNPQIKVVMPLGPIALQALLGVDSVYHFHGTVHWHTQLKRWIVPTFDAHHLISTESKEVLTTISDFNRAFEVLKDGYAEPVVSFIEYPTAKTALGFVTEYEEVLAREPDTMLSVDIETPYSADIDEEEKDGKDSSWTVERISFAFRPKHAITMPWVEPFIGLSKRLLSSIGNKIFWNGNKFDMPRLWNTGCSIGGWPIDGMDAFHFLYSDIPKGLGYATPMLTLYKPWKHLSGSNMPFYSCMDAVTALENVLEIKKRLEKAGTWHVFMRDFVGIEPTFRAMTTTGIGIDSGKRQELREYYINLRDNSNDIIQGLMPVECLPLLKKDGYKGKPADVRNYLKSNPDVEVESAFLTLGYESIDGKWNKRTAFNANSGTQIKQYIGWKYGLDAIPKDKKTGKATTGNEQLERLAKQKNDQILFTIIDSSSAGDKLSGILDNWPIGTDGRVHPTFTNNAATFRLSSVRPNSQNFPNRSEELNKLREMVIGGSSQDDDWYIVSGDYSGIEAIEVGWYAQDSDYMRLASFGIHSYVAGIKMGMDINPKWDDDQLKMALSEAKKRAKAQVVESGASLYDAVKRGIHGTNYLMTEYLLHETYPDLFASRALAKQFQQEYREICPSVKPWQDSVIDIAYDQCCVVNDFGYKRWFWDVKRWQYDKRIDEFKLVPSGDAKKVVATLPQGSAAAIIRRAMLRPQWQTLCSEGKGMIQIHDDLTARARRHELDRVIGLLRDTMTFAVEEQGGLVIPLAIKIGKNWRDQSADNKDGMREI